MPSYLDQLKYLIKKHKIVPDRHKGQNFLIDPDVYQKILETADLKPDDNVLEVGPGCGLLTAELLKITDNVLAVELDKKFIPILDQLARVNKNLQVINQDVLKIPNEKICQYLEADKIKEGIFNYQIVANLPYNISSFFLRKFLSYEPKPMKIIILLQLELAQRLTAKPGQFSLLTVMGQFYAEPQLIKIVKKESFWPAPAVDSALVKLKIINIFDKYNLSNDFNEAMFWRLMRIGFCSRRKQLKNNLASGFKLPVGELEKIFKKLAINNLIRAQDLGINQWLELLKNLTLLNIQKSYII